MTSNSNSVILKITEYLPVVEEVLLTILAIGVILILTKIDSLIAKISLIGLAVTFFLSAYQPLEIPKEENEKLGFLELLAFAFVPKALWISCAISLMGILFFLSQNEGYKQMLMIGVSTISISVILYSLFLLLRVKNLSNLNRILLRAIPLLLINLYLIFK